MKEVAFNIEYEGSMDVINTIKSCNEALKQSGVPVEFIIDDNEHDGYELVTLKSNIEKINTISFTHESVPKSRLPIDADVVFIHTKEFSDVLDFLQIYPEFVKYGEERVVQPVGDSSSPTISNFITDDISIFTIVKRQYIVENRLIF